MTSIVVTQHGCLQTRKKPFAKASGGILTVMLGAFLALAVGSGYPAYAAAETVLEQVDMRVLPGNRVQLRFQLSQPASEPRSFTVNDPARIVLDFANTRNGLQERQQTIGTGVAEKLIVLEANGRTRASVNLARTVPYSVRTEGNAVLLTLDAANVANGTADNSTAVTSGVANRSLSDVEFHRGPNGTGVVQVTLSDASISADVREEGNQIVAEFPGAAFAREQERRLDVTDFATPLSLIDIMNQGSNGRIVMQPTGPYQFLAYQADNIYTIEVKPLIEEDDNDPNRKKKFAGELLSLNFQDIETRAVLQIIADFTELNVVVSDTVQGNLTLRLQNVPWDQALDIIMRTKGLTQRQNGNVLYIAPTEEVAAREKLELESRKQVVELAPLRSEVIQINYAKAMTLGAMLKSKDVSLLSPRGQVSVDERTNTLLVQDVADKISEVRGVITRLDVPVRQVLIDSRVVIARDDFSRELGVRFGFTGVTGTDNGIVTTTGTANGTSVTTRSAIINTRETGQPFPVAVPPLAERLGVNLATVSNPFGSVALAILGKDYLLDLELSALQAEGRGETLSNPRVITTDRQTAFIKQGREIPYQNRTQDGVTTEFRDAVLELAVTPQITPDDRLIMDLKVKKDEQGRDVPSGIEGGFIPTIEKREVATQVLVSNGDTVVLGGVFEQVKNNQVDKVPLLGDIPVLGRLFQRRANLDQKFELLIFVTPQIINDKGIAAR